MVCLGREDLWCFGLQLDEVGYELLKAGERKEKQGKKGMKGQESRGIYF